MDKQLERYSRQLSFEGIGEAGQRKLLSSRVLIIGMGALGSASADRLARAGVGYLRLADRDHVEVSNLQRQTLYTEADAAAGRAKAGAAADHLRQINSGIEIDGIVTDVNAATIDMLLEDIDLVIDATDNIETRFLINEACHAHRIPWIYGGVLGSTGMTMNILPEDDAPCFACFTRSDGGETTCAEAGVLNTITVTIAALQCTEAFKILTGCGAVSRGLRVIDLWQNIDEMVPVTKNPECPVCAGHTYRFYKTESEG